MVRVSVHCPHCSVPIELPTQDVTAGRYVLGTEPLFDHISQQHRATIAPRQNGKSAAVAALRQQLGQQTAGLVEQRELPKSRT